MIYLRLYEKAGVIWQLVGTLNQSFIKILSARQAVDLTVAVDQKFLHLGQ